MTQKGQLPVIRSPVPRGVTIVAMIQIKSLLFLYTDRQTLMLYRNYTIFSEKIALGFNNHY